MKEVTINDIIKIINKSENIEVNENNIDENLSSLGMDSITFIQIIVGLEEEFDCEIPDSKLLVTEMDTVQKIYNVLNEIYDHQI